MANSKLLLSIDDLSHKLLSIETEVAVGETFDLILDGLAGVSTGSKVVVGLYSLSGGLLWTLDSPLSLIDDTNYGVENCTINTQEAAKVVRLTSAVTILTLVIHAEDGKQTVYGSAYLRLHQGYAEDGESVGKAITSLKQHNADETAHPAIRKLFGELRNEVLRIINETMLLHGNSEEEARNQAIYRAISLLDAELTSRYKGDLTFFATACAASSKAAAASAKVSAEVSKLTVDKLVEANKVVEYLGNSLKEAGEKLDEINNAIEDVNDAASSLEESKDLIINSKDTVVNTVKEFNTTLETFKGESANDKQTIKDSVTAVTNAKDDFDAKWPTIEKVEGYAKGVAEAEGRITEAESRVNTTVNEVLPANVTAINASLEQKQTAILGNIDTKAQAVNAALDGKLSTANTAINEAVERAETANGDAVKAQGEASKSAEQASTSAENANTSATNAKTSETNAKTTADALNAGLATLNGLDGRVGTLETTVQPTMAGGLLDVQVGHNAMVKVCKVTKANRKIIAEIVKPFGYSVDVENGGKDIYVAGVGNFWFINVSCASNVAFVCDSKLNYKFAIDGNNPNWATGSVFDGNYGYFNGNGIAVNTENSRIYNAYTEYRQTTNGTKMAIFLQSWCAKTEYLKDENGKVVKDEQGKDTVLHVAGEKLASVKIDDALIEETYIKSNVSLAYLPNAKMLCVGCKILVDAETLAYVGEVMDATSQAGDEAVEKARQTAYYCLAKTSGGSSATFDKQRWAVYYGSGIRPCYIDDITDPTKPTLRNFKNASGAEVTQAYRAYACAELDNSWDNHSSYFLRSADNKLAWCKVAWTKPEKSSSGTLEAVIGSETITESNVKGIATVIPSQGFFGASKNSNQVVALLAFGGAIVQQISIQSPIATPAIDTMVDQGVNKLNKSAHWMSRQTDYGYIIPQSGSRNQKSAISVILNRPMV